MSYNDRPRTRWIPLTSRRVGPVADVGHGGT
jgi:hypothetical protein